ncbi:hypothetical protein GNP80_18410 [Aliivibrio fischeri]|uniref:hypothetical protein n=1 Tax=Aliivibrio fischeri TaxID=668 RepID=UPI0012DA6D52|nr:hypothetical protein [Aliivibrio fischeri]MUK94400.1 hypothetical protein [Aliivibrio fischeri]
MKIKWLLSLFFKKTSQEPKETLKAFADTYPQVTLSKEMNERAYNLFFLIDTSITEKLIQLVQGYTETKITLNNTKEPQDFSSEQVILKLNVFLDFNGHVVHLITDQTDLISSIINSNFHPPKPELSFPEISPLEYGSLQGNLDFWFNWLWLPYWRHLSKEEQKELAISADWIEFIEERIA